MDNITRKRLIIISVVGLALLIFLFLYNNSLLTISSASDEEKTIYIKSGESSQNFTLKSGSKTMLLSRGSYHIEVVGEDKGSYYQKDLGFFRKHKVEVELRPQQSTGYLGSSGLGCAKDMAKTLLYYSCAPNATTSLIEDANNRLIASNESEDPLKLSATIKPYRDAFMQIISGDGSLKLSQINETGLVNSSENNIDFDGVINNSAVDVSHSGLISAYDNSSWSILVFKDATDKNPSRIKLPGDKPQDEAGFVATVHATDSHIYVVLAPDGSELDDHEGFLENTEKLKPKIIAISSSDDHKITEEGLPEEWIVLSSEAGPDKDILLVLSGNQQGQVFRYSTEGGLKMVPAVKDTSQMVCWSGPNTFYYLADASKSIYEYSFETSASYLVYADPINFIEEISCLGSQLYFAVSNDKVLETDELLHYKLTDQPFSGVRVGGLLPLYHTFEGDTLRVFESRGGINIALDYDSQGNGPPAKNQARQKIIEVLTEGGVDTSKLNINFSF